MDKGLESWSHHLHSDGQSPNSNTLNTVLGLGQPGTVPAYMSPCASVVPTNGTLPGFAYSGIPHSKAGQLNEPLGWSYCLPRFRQAFTSMQNSCFKEKIPAGLSENHKESVTPNPASGSVQKRFLVFDQSGDQTTLIFSSGIGNCVPCLASRAPKFDSVCNPNKIDIGTGGNTGHGSGPILTDEYVENHKDDSGSEMHEDTEELNALLYSDDDSDYDDEEEVSTGHSPSTMTAYRKREWVEDGLEEVASSAGPTKRMKLADGVYEVPSLMDTANSGKPKRCFDNEDNIESSCGDGKNRGLIESASLAGNERSRKEQIRKTVSILKSIIPGGTGKDAVVVLDEAIDYLKSLKCKAKALGVDML